jgi:hypothetical protein
VIRFTVAKWVKSQALTPDFMADMVVKFLLFLAKGYTVEVMVDATVITRVQKFECSVLDVTTNDKSN